MKAWCLEQQPQWREVNCSRWSFSSPEVDGETLIESQYFLRYQSLIPPPALQSLFHLQNQSIMVAYLKRLNILALLLPYCCCPMFVAAQELMEWTAEEHHVQEWVSQPYILLGPAKGWVPWIIHHWAELKLHCCNFNIGPQTKWQTKPRVASPSFSSLFP